jgi:hypothetical protein
LTEFGGQRTHRALAKFPVSISGIDVDIFIGCELERPQSNFNSTRTSFSR